ncbi:MAG: hypothetical protein ACPG6P_03750 [Akkermansiaceae bacterium]
MEQEDGTTPFDVVSGSSETSTVGNNDNPSVKLTFKHEHKHQIELSDLPPLNQLDECSLEVREFAMQQIREEQAFRHKHLSKMEDNKAALQEKQIFHDYKGRRLGFIGAILILILGIVWSALLILNGHTITGLTPLIGTLTLFILAAVFGKSGKISDSDKADE